MFATLYIKIKSAACIVLSVVLLLTTCSACNKGIDKGDVQQGTNIGEINQTSGNTVLLPYSAKDTLNPYNSETKQNQELSKLLFDPLFKINDDFSVTKFLASSYESTPTTATIKLKGVKFTDGAPLTADDVVYSFNNAKANNVYRSQLAQISTCTAIDTTTVSFVCSVNNPNFINLLDFPIIKSGTFSLKDENNRELTPIGCGRYVFDYKNKILNANSNYYKGSIKLKSISLIDCPDDTSLNHNISVGNISYVYPDLTDNVIPKKSGTPSATFGTNLVFIGTNCNTGVLSDTKLRLAISSAIDRTQLCSKNFYAYAKEATNLFPSSWDRLKGYESLNKTQNLKQTVAYLEEIGYNSKDADGYFIDDKGKRITLSLLCNSENLARTACAEQISTQLNKCGFEVTVIQKNWADYSNDLTYGNFDLYIGEVKLDKSLYLGNLLSSSVISGYPLQSECAVKFAEFHRGESEVTAAISSFATELPFIPVCYKNGISICSSWLDGYIDFSISDVYNGIENYG